VSKPPFAFFMETCQEQQDYLKQIWKTDQIPEKQVDIGELCKLTNERWQNLKDEDRESYVKVVNRDREKCDEVEKQIESHFPIEQFSPAHNDPVSKGSGKKIKDKFAPKRTKSAYTFYLIEEGKSLREKNPSWRLPEVTKELGKRWSRMEKSEKIRFNAMARVDRGRYDREMELYAERVKKERLEDQKTSNMENNVALTNKQIEVNESKLIESKERCKSVIEFSGSKDTGDGMGKDSQISDDDAGEEAKCSEEKQGKVEQEKQVLKWKERMAFDWREKSLKDFIAKQNTMVSQMESEPFQDFITKHNKMVHQNETTKIEKEENDEHEFGKEAINNGEKSEIYSWKCGVQKNSTRVEPCLGIPSKTEVIGIKELDSGVNLTVKIEIDDIEVKIMENTGQDQNKVSKVGFEENEYAKLRKEISIEKDVVQSTLN